MIGEWILRKTARRQAEARKDPSAVKSDNAHALDTLKSSFPAFLDQMAGKIVLDFGCGYGEQVTALARQSNAERIVGFDPSEPHLEVARGNMVDSDVGRFGYTRTLYGFTSFFDVVISQNAFEHFLTPRIDMAKMLSVTGPDGRIFITFGPPWHSPWGAHMDAWCRLPWIQNWPLRLLFPETMVMKVRQSYRNDSAGPKWTFESVGLGKMTVDRFERLIEDLGARVVFRRYSCCWGLNWLRHVPVVREWFVNHISVVIEKPAQGGSR